MALRTSWDFSDGTMGPFTQDSTFNDETVVVVDGPLFGEDGRALKCFVLANEQRCEVFVTGGSSGANAWNRFETVYLRRKFAFGPNYPISQSEEFNLMGQFKDLGNQSTSPPMSVHVGSGTIYFHGSHRGNTPFWNQTILSGVTTSKWYDMIFGVYLDGPNGGSGVLNGGGWVSAWLRNTDGTWQQLVNQARPENGTYYIDGGQSWTRLQMGVYHRNTLPAATLYNKDFQAGTTFDDVDDGGGTGTAPPVVPTSVKAVQAAGTTASVNVSCDASPDPNFSYFLVRWNTTNAPVGDSSWTLLTTGGPSNNGHFTSNNPVVVHVSGRPAGSTIFYYLTEVQTDGDASGPSAVASVTLASAASWTASDGGPTALTQDDVVDENQDPASDGDGAYMRATAPNALVEHSLTATGLTTGQNYALAKLWVHSRTLGGLGCRIYSRVGTGPTTLVGDLTSTNGSTLDWRSFDLNAVDASNVNFKLQFTTYAAKTLTTSDEHWQDAYFVRGQLLGVPDVPTGLSGVAGDAKATLSWSANPASDNVTGWRLYRNGSVLQSNLAATPRTYTDTGLTNGTTYIYSIAAVNAQGVSSQSEAVDVTPISSLAANPTSLNFSGVTNTTLPTQSLGVTGSGPFTVTVTLQ